MTDLVTSSNSSHEFISFFNSFYKNGMMYSSGVGVAKENIDALFAEITETFPGTKSFNNDEWTNSVLGNDKFAMRLERYGSISYITVISFPVSGLH